MIPKIFLDTNVLIKENKNLFNKYNSFAISSVTLEELEHIKTSNSKDEETKYHARLALHELDNHMNEYHVQIYDTKAEQEFPLYGAIEYNNDIKIMATAYSYFNYYQVEEGTFLTFDLACRTIAAAAGLNVKKPNEDSKLAYKGFFEKKFSDDELADFYNNIKYQNKNPYGLLENQYFILRDAHNQVIDRYKWSNNRYVEVPYRKFESKMFGKVSPKNNDIYQICAMDSLTSNQITMLRGGAGVGKTLISLAYMFHLLEEGKIDKIVIFCNTVPVKGAAKLGFYPGSREDKLLDSQIGGLLESKLGDRIMVERLIEDGELVLLPLVDARGFDTSGMRAAVYIQEAQNLDIELMRLALQRIGEDCICILDGDNTAQVDLPLYAGSNNGMTRASEVFRGESLYGEIELQTIYRSKIADLAQKM